MMIDLKGKLNDNVVVARKSEIFTSIALQKQKSFEC